MPVLVFFVPICISIVLFFIVVMLDDVRRINDVALTMVYFAGTHHAHGGNRRSAYRSGKAALFHFGAMASGNDNVGDTDVNIRFQDYLFHFLTRCTINADLVTGFW